MNNQNNENEPSDVIAYVDSDLEELIPGYLENRKEDINKILEALATEDYESVMILGHTLKGIGGGYGFDTITDLGEHIEIGAKTGDHDRIVKAVDELKTYVDHVKIIYE